MARKIVIAIIIVFVMEWAAEASLALVTLFLAFLLTTFVRPFTDKRLYLLECGSLAVNSVTLGLGMFFNVAEESLALSVVVSVCVIAV